MSYGVTAKGNGDAFINAETHTSLSTGGGEPGQGYPCAMIESPPTNVYGSETMPTLISDVYKQCGTTQDGLTVTQLRGGGVQK